MLESNGLPKDDIECLFYPNAVQAIANLSIRHSAQERKISRQGLLQQLRDLRATTISRWTLALKTKAKILEKRRRQLAANLSRNARSRYFVVSADALEDFDGRIVTFIADYLQKYHYKPAHIHTPVFCLDCESERFADICKRLHRKGVKITDGCVGGEFFEDSFFRTPFVRGRGPLYEREFDVRLQSVLHIASLNRHRCDDLFIVGDEPYDSLDTRDIIVERIGVSKWQELYYTLGLSNAAD